MNILSRLRALWNYDPVAMQKAMLCEVWWEHYKIKSRLRTKIVPKKRSDLEIICDAIADMQMRMHAMEDFP